MSPAHASVPALSRLLVNGTESIAGGWRGGLLWSRAAAVPARAPHRLSFARLELVHKQRPLAGCQSRPRGAIGRTKRVFLQASGTAPLSRSGGRLQSPPEFCQPFQHKRLFFFFFKDNKAGLLKIYLYRLVSCFPAPRTTTTPNSVQLHHAAVKQKLHPSSSLGVQ